MKLDYENKRHHTPRLVCHTRLGILFAGKMGVMFRAVALFDSVLASSFMLASSISRQFLLSM